MPILLCSTLHNIEDTIERLAMSWTLKIIHIALKGAGDATLIIASDPVSKAHRSALIDGGRVQDAAAIHTLILQALNNVNKGASLDVMVATHYDEDHFNGLRELLDKNPAFYSAVRIYDQGETGKITVVKKSRSTSGDALPTEFKIDSSSDNAYLHYVKAIQKILDSRNAVLPETGKLKISDIRKTARVVSQDDAEVYAGWNPPGWLVGKELLWDGKLPPTGAPTLTCIAANQCVLQSLGCPPTLAMVKSSQLVDEKNPKSLAFLLQFGNFKYYVGGDIESNQEDGPNGLNKVLGQVHALKTSHHGSSRSSSSAFLASLKAKAAFISCGPKNSYPHPEQTVINSLQSNTTLQYYFLTGEPDWSKRTTLTAKAEVAGDFPQPPAQPQPPATGLAAPRNVADITLVITEAQAAASDPPFYVDCMQPAAGTNISNRVDFKYLPAVERIFLL